MVTSVPYQVSPAARGRWRPGQPSPAADRVAASDAASSAAAKAGAALQPDALDPLMAALKDLLAVHRDAGEEQALLSSLLTSSLPFLVNAFRYYYQRLTAAWSAGTPLLPAAGKALGDERIEM
jgi:hypothetical protein